MGLGVVGSAAEERLFSPPLAPPTQGEKELPSFNVLRLSGFQLDSFLLTIIE